MKPKGSTPTRVFEQATQELSPKTWRDFEQLFETHPGPGAYPCWCMYNHREGPLAQHSKVNSSLERTLRNHRDKRALVEKGVAHGILVYQNGQPVGWCQYGCAEQLRRIESNSRYRISPPTAARHQWWRITCFVTHRKYRRLGIARAALKAALESIRNQGGGVVEAYPIRRWGAYASYRGTLSMFKREGFKVVAALGPSNVVVRKLV